MTVPSTVPISLTVPRMEHIGTNHQDMDQTRGKAIYQPRDMPTAFGQAVVTIAGGGGGGRGGGGGVGKGEWSDRQKLKGNMHLEVFGK